MQFLLLILRGGKRRTFPDDTVVCQLAFAEFSDHIAAVDAALIVQKKD